jgi:3-oxoacyl-[acyl-carrier protein] reductase
MDLKLKGKRALVLASSRGLGYATCRGLAEEGCSVAINGRNADRLETAALRLREETGMEILPIRGDVTDSKFPKTMVSLVNEKFGGLDLLVTNAGGPPSGDFESFSEEIWDQAIQISFLSHVRVIREALPYLRQSSSPSVLTITSYSVKQPIPNLVLSNSIRAATVGLTKTLALELGKEGIRFNSILPGWTETERVSELMEYRSKQSGKSVVQEIQEQMKDTPLGRMATPEEFANAAVFLLSPAAAYITGVMLTVDGGAYKGTY